MAAVALTGAGDTGTGAANSGTTLTVAKPTSAVAGDVLLAVVWNRVGTAAYTGVPTGWTQIGASSVTTVGWLGVYVATAGAAEPASYTWTGGASGRHTGVILRTSGLTGTADVVGAAATAIASSPGWSFPLPGVTPTAAGDLCLAVMGENVASPPAFTNAAGFTDVVDAQTTTGATESRLHVAQATLATTAATGTETFSTPSAISSGVGYLITLNAAVTNAAPAANAGADQTAIEPWSMVTLTGTDADSDGTIASRTWAQTSGTPAVSLSGSGATRTFAAPGTLAGTTLTFTYTVTDNAGATATDTMTVAVLPVTERAVIGGVEIPMQVRST